MDFPLFCTQQKKLPCKAGDREQASKRAQMSRDMTQLDSSITGNDMSASARVQQRQAYGTPFAVYSAEPLLARTWSAHRPGVIRSHIAAAEERNIPKLMAVSRPSRVFPQRSGGFAENAVQRRVRRPLSLTTESSRDIRTASLD